MIPSEGIHSMIMINKKNVYLSYGKPNHVNQIISPYI